MSIRPRACLKKFGVAVPRGGVAYTPEEARRVAEELGGSVWVVKSQIHAGGRGAGRFKDNPKGKGGVRVVEIARRGRGEHRRRCWAMSSSPSRPAPTAAR